MKNRITAACFCLVVSLHVIYAEEFSRSKRAPSNWLSSPTLSETQIKMILDSHNEIRAKVKPSATNMARLSWSTKLAAKALSRSRNCEYIPSNEQGTGENIHVSTSTDFENVVKGFVSEWEKEKEDYDFLSSSCTFGKQCNNYKQLIWADTYEVGCAISYCSSVGDLGRGYLTICQYKVAGNAVIEIENGVTVPLAPYREGESCSECGKGYTCSENLCTEASAHDKSTEDDQDESDACYTENKKMIDAWNEQMRVYREVHLERWKKQMADYEYALNEES
ncbi:glioma pathogenesis-related protein 1-like [Styela clava]